MPPHQLPRYDGADPQPAPAVPKNQCASLNPGAMTRATAFLMLALLALSAAAPSPGAQAASLRGARRPEGEG